MSWLSQLGQQNSYKQGDNYHRNKCPYSELQGSSKRIKKGLSSISLCKDINVVFKTNKTVVSANGLSIGQTCNKSTDNWVKSKDSKKQKARNSKCESPSCLSLFNAVFFSFFHLHIQKKLMKMPWFPY